MREPRSSEVFLTKFDPKLGVHSHADDLTFSYDEGVFGPQPEFRRLDDIRRSLRDPSCDGPDPVYSIVMDVGRREHATNSRGACFYLALSFMPQANWEKNQSAARVIFMPSHLIVDGPLRNYSRYGKAARLSTRRRAPNDDPGRCFAVTAGPGDKVVVPPGWAHAVINADPKTRMTFGAWCDRQYGFVYDAIRAHHGLAWFPDPGRSAEDSLGAESFLSARDLSIRGPRAYPELGLDPSTPIYEQFANDPDSVQWVSEPARVASVWANFEM